MGKGNMKLLILLTVFTLSSCSLSGNMWSWMKNTTRSAVSKVASGAYSAAVDNPVSKAVSQAAAPAAAAVVKEVRAITNPFKHAAVHVADYSCGAVKRIAGVAYDQYQGEQEEELNKLTLNYRNDYVSMQYNLTTAATGIAAGGNFASKRLFIFIQGFMNMPHVFDEVCNNLTATGNTYVLSVDGSSLTRGLYLRSTTYVRFIGERLGEVLAAMIKKGLNPSAIHLIGHGLGAHISGFTGKTLTNMTGCKVGRITGLDPAGPCFGHVDPDLRLTASDADFVDVIHTDGGVYGLKGPIGHVDFYPNGGVDQPNCVRSLCSHNRALAYFSESVVRPEAFSALKCEDWDAFKAGQCEECSIYMGLYGQPGGSGKYYLQTGGNSPFGFGEVGERWQNNDGIVKNIFNSVG